MVDIQSATADLREEKRRKKEEKYNGLPYSIGRPLKTAV